jgi:RNA polymerase sigma-70 factor (ECF subfamily)
MQSLGAAFVELSHSPDVLARAQARDADAFCDLCRPYEDRLFRQAVALCRDETLAEDLVQETLIEAWKSLRRFNGRCRLFTWFCSIMLHRYQKVIRRKGPMSVNEETFHGLADDRPTPAANTEAMDRGIWLQSCLDHLPHKQRQVVYLRFYVEHSLEEIAAAVRCSVGTVKSRLFNGLENLRKMRRLRQLDL